MLFESYSSPSQIIQNQLTKGKNSVNRVRKRSMTVIQARVQMKNLGVSFFLKLVSCIRDLQSQSKMSTDYFVKLVTQKNYIYDTHRSYSTDVGRNQFLDKSNIIILWLSRQQ